MRTVIVMLTPAPRSRKPYQFETGGISSVRVSETDSDPDTNEEFFPGFQSIAIASLLESRAGSLSCVLADKTRARSALRQAERVHLALPYRAVLIPALVEIIRRNNPLATIWVNTIHCNLFDLPQPQASRPDAEEWIPIDATAVMGRALKNGALGYAVENFRRARSLLSARFPLLPDRAIPGSFLPPPGVEGCQVLFDIANTGGARYGEKGFRPRTDAEWEIHRFAQDSLNFILHDTGWARRVGDGLSLTEAGKRVMDCLSPELRDPDFVGRLKRWHTQGLADARAGIDAYAKRFHDVQRAYLASLNARRDAA